MLNTYFNWSTGKDSAMALYRLLNDGHFEVRQLLTVLNKQHNRVSMHGLRRELMEQQIASIGIPCTTIELPEQADMPAYEAAMKKGVQQMLAAGLNNTAFGDIFLEDLRKYREQQLAPYGITAHFPLWQKNTTALAHEFIQSGFKAVIVCCNAQLLPQSFAGRLFDADFLNDLPSNVDPCGENGEFHTFCFDGPLFKKPINFNIGETVYKSYTLNKETQEETGFWFTDLIPGN